MMDIAAASWWEILLRLILALVLGGLIGLERETVEKPAGLRTHTLGTLGGGARRRPRRGLATIEVLLVDEPGQLGRIGTVLGAHNVNIEHVEMSERMDKHVTITLAVRPPARLTRDEVMGALGDVDGVEQVRWKEG